VTYEKPNETAFRMFCPGFGGFGPYRAVRAKCFDLRQANPTTATDAAAAEIAKMAKESD
jgi:hypothetical protein